MFVATRIVLAGLLVGKEVNVWKRCRCEYPGQRAVSPDNAWICFLRPRVLCPGPTSNQRRAHVTAPGVSVWVATGVGRRIAAPPPQVFCRSCIGGILGIE